jgi:hypothetical protein
MQLDVTGLSYSELSKVLESAKMSPSALVRRGLNVVLELNDAPREPAWDLGVASVTY